MSISRRELLKLGASSLIYVVAGQLFFGNKVDAEVVRRFNDLEIINLLKDLPKFDGLFTIETNILNLFADDFGHSVHQMPLGVLKPANSMDIQKMAEFCLEKKIKLSMRGIGGSAYGQSQQAEGIIIDSTSMKNMMWLSQDLIQVEPGATWKEILDYTIQSKRAPYVMPDTLITTVGGHANAGGIGSSSFGFGSIVDHIVEFDLITIEGVQLTCNEDVNGEVFQAALGSMGQLGFMTRIVLRTMVAPAVVHVRKYRYDGLDYRYLNDLQMLTQRQSYGAIDGQLVRNEDERTFSYLLKVVHWDEQEPTWLQSMSVPQLDVDEMSFYEWSDRNSESWRHLTSKEENKWPHPYLSFFVPYEKSLEMAEFLQKTQEANLGAQNIKIVPLRNQSFTRPFFQFANEGLTAYFRVERVVQTGAGQLDHQLMLKANVEMLLPKIFQMGGKVHMPHSPLLNAAQLAAQFALPLIPEQFENLRVLKHRYDAENLVNVGSGLF